MCDGTPCPCNLYSSRVTHPALPWAGRWPWSPRCRAVREPRPNSAWAGRCELAPHGPDVAHALDRGWDTPRWSTEWSDQ